MKRNKIGKYFLVTTLLLLLSGCGNNEVEPQEETPAQVNYEISLPGTYDSEDEAAVVVKRDESAGTITFLNIASGKTYTLSYDGTTMIYDKYDTTMAMSQVELGSIVDITFLRNSKKLNSLQSSKEAWTSKDVRRFEINQERKDITIGTDIYKYSADLLVFSQKMQAELMDINAVDVLTVNGIGSTVYSMSVEKGHGYLRLTGDESFRGGFIEVGQSIIQRITEGMLLVVPEGSYQLQVSNRGVSGTKSVMINRNEEVSVNIADLWGEGVQTGTVLFSVSPETTKVFIDGTQIDTSGPVVLEYGIHQMMAKAEGYDTITQYLNVAQAAAGIDITLDKSDTEEESTDNTDSTVNNTDSKPSDTTVSTNNNSTSTEYYKVYIDSPQGAETYLDGNYVGIAPISFKKSSGTHVITLRKTGYVTRSYTIIVDSEQKDVTYSFVELEKE